MTVVLPKDRRYLIGFRFPELIPFEMNTVDLSLVLVSVFRRAILQGGDASRGTADDIANITTGVDRFVSSDRLVGFDGTAGRRAADRLVRGTLTKLITENQSKRLQIHGLVPYTIASIKTGFPTNESGYRQIDRFVYSTLRSQWSERDQAERASSFIKSVFGSGVRVEGYPTLLVERLPGDQPELDILSELSLVLVEKLPAATPKRSTRSSYVPANPLPGFQNRFGHDLRRFWSAYCTCSPMPLLIDQSVTLIGFELAIMTLKLFHTIPALVEDLGRLPPAMTDIDEATPPGVYVDWTGEPRHLSGEMARATVRRDLGQLQPFIQAVLRLRYLNSQIDLIRREAEFKKTITDALGSEFSNDTPRYMMGLLELAAHPDIRGELRVAARHDLTSILQASKSPTLGDDDEDNPETVSEADRLCKELDEAGASPLDQVLALLHRALGPKAQSNIQGWLVGVGGVGTSHGLIHGGVNRNTWAYAPGNELLSVLVQLCAVDHDKKGGEPIPFGVAEFLEWLEDRFGVIVDRPPAGLGFDGPEHAAAARDNLQAMLRRLRLMGMFEDQSDDFTVQEITPPFAARS